MSNPDQIDRRSLIRLRLLFISLSVSFFLFVGAIALSMVPETAIPIGRIFKINMLSVIPEGWAFFTRNAREEKMYVYKKMKNGNWEQVNIPGSSLRFCYGLNRKGRSIGAEAATLVSQTPDSAWRNENAPISQIFKNDTIPPIHVLDKVANPTCTGDILIQMAPPVPWAWSQAKIKPIMPYKFIRLYVKPDISKD